MAQYTCTHAIIGFNKTSEIPRCYELFIDNGGDRIKQQ